MNFLRNFLANGLGRSAMLHLRALAMLIIALSTPIALAQRPAPSPSSTALAARFPAAAINSEKVADQALAEAATERAAIAAQFADEESACYSKFFATSCLENAKTRRRLALRLVRRVEVDADTFKRRQRVVERDKQLEQRRASEASTAPSSATPPPDSALSPTATPVQNSTLPTAEARGSKMRDNDNRPSGTPRIHPKVAKGEPPADARKRAENIAAYNRKVAESEARQREVAEKKAIKERERAAKASAAKENAAKESAAAKP